MEGLSGSDFADVLRGDDADAAEINIAGPLNGVLTRISLIDGLQELLGDGVTEFGTGNIILGGGGSDIIEGRGGDDLIDGDKSLNVRISVRSGFDANGPFGAETEIATFDSLSDPDLLQNMLDGTWNPGQLQIVREILTGDDGFDTAVFSAPFNDPITGANNYNIFVNDNGTVDDFSDDIVTVIDNVAGRDGTDTLKGIERLQFNDLSITLVPGLNEDPVGLLTLNDDSPQIGQLLTVSAADILDADNVSLANPTGGITDGPISFTWQVERDPVNAPNVFEDIVALGGGNPATAAGNSFRVTPDLAGLLLRVKAVYQDAHGVLETVFSAPTAAVADGVFPTPATPPAEDACCQSRRRSASDPGRPAVHSRPDRDLGKCPGRQCPLPDRELTPAVWPTDGRRNIQQPGAGSDELRRLGPGLRAADRSDLPRRPGRRLLRRQRPGARRTLSPTPTTPAPSTSPMLIHASSPT